MINDRDLDISGACLNIYNILLEKCGSMTNGLFNGRCGAAIFFYEYYSFSKNGSVEASANDIVAFVSQHIKMDDGPSFSTGALGVGWAFDVLSVNDYIDLEDDRILRPVDNAAIFGPFKGFDYKEGLLGIGIYLLQRVKNIKPDNPLYYACFDRIIETCELLSTYINLRIPENNLYSYYEFPALYNHVNVSSGVAFFECLSGLIFYFSQLAEQGILPEIAKKNIRTISKLIKCLINHFLSHNFLTNYLAFDADEIAARFAIIELYNTLLSLKDKFPHEFVHPSWANLNVGIDFILTSMNFSKFANMPDNNTIKHFFLIRKLRQYKSDEVLVNYYKNLTRYFYDSLHTASGGFDFQSAAVSSAPGKQNQPYGLAGLSGIGLVLLASVTDVSSIYNNAFCIS